MKVKHLVFSILTAAFLTSAMGIDKSIEVGKKAPKIETIEGINVVADANSENKTKVISFWNPKKPASRITNRNLSREYGNDNENIEFISICTDPDEKLMAEVANVDGIDPASLIASTQISPRALKDYDAQKNPRAFVIDTQGKISKIF